MRLVLPAFLILFFISSCKKEKSNSSSGPNLVLKFKFDPTQARLNNTGQPELVPAGHAGQSPDFNKMSAHYVELTPTAFTALGGGAVLYKAPETTAGGNNAIDFDKSKFAGNNETFFSIPLKDITPGTYEWLRISLAYQNYNIKYYIDTVVAGIPVQEEFPATVASFIGFNTYIKNYKIKDQNIAVNANKKQGYWGFETVINFGGTNYPYSATGQAPEGATTVVNPLFATSPIPAGSCLVTAAFIPGKLTITGKETSDIVVEVSLSVNKSFEWIEQVNDGKWEPGKGEAVVDMGIRGMIPKIQ
ncbi:MAG: hypothetical protein E6H09_08420 [Bacteroidetes bacterium]|nr:MAG: hypothetical protein E6H09_08420 [Bacteroidota bacterium]